MWPMVIRRPSIIVIGCAPARIGPHNLEIDLPLGFRDHPPAT
jgi:hypothetical protein